MRKMLAFFMCIVSLHTYAEVFPKNIETAAKAAMKDMLEGDKSLKNVQIKSVLYIDMDPGAEYYLGVDWSYLDRNNNLHTCHSEVTLIGGLGSKDNIFEMDRLCN